MTNLLASSLSLPHRLGVSPGARVRRGHDQVPQRRVRRVPPPITPDNQHEHMRQLKRFNCAEDCPVFDGLFNFCQIYTGGPWAVRSV